jgi:hypothetical protein
VDPLRDRSDGSVKSGLMQANEMPAARKGRTGPPAGRKGRFAGQAVVSNGQRVTI